MICPNCGTRIDDNSKECSFCGYWLREEPQTDKKKESRDSNASQNKQVNVRREEIPAEVKSATGSGRKKRAGIIGGLCAAGGVAALLIILFAVTGRNNNLTLEEQLESLQAKAETVSSREEAEKIYKEAEEIKNKIEESIEASSLAKAQSELESILASQEAEKKEGSGQSASESTTQNTVAQQTQIQTQTQAHPQTTTATIGSSLEAQQTSMAQAAAPVEVYAEPASIISKSGNMEADGQYDKYTFTAPYDGRYRAEMTGMPAGSKVDLDFYDSGGKLLESSYGIGNGDGVTVRDLTGGSTYEVVVSYNNGSTPYLLAVGLQKPALDISHATIAYDSVEYTDQRNLYNFTPSKTGDYRFEFSDVTGGVLLDMFAFDDPGNKLGSKEGIGNGDGLTLKNLKAGEIYEIQVRQSKGLGKYSLLIR